MVTVDAGTAAAEQAEPVREVIGQDDKGRDLVMYAGETCRVCSNGALQRVRDGVLVRPGDTDVSRLQPVRTSEQGAALAWQRWHGKRQDAVRAAVERASGNAMPDIDTADAYIMADVIETIALNVDVRADHRVKALQLVYEQAGMDGKQPRTAAPAAAQPGGTLHIDRDTLVAMAAAVAAEASKRGMEQE